MAGGGAEGGPFGPKRKVSGPGLGWQEQEYPETGPSVEEAAGERAVTDMSFEDALAELESIVQKLERGQLDLDGAIRAYERGTELRHHCAGKLREAELRVEKLSFDRARNPRLEPWTSGERERHGGARDRGGLRPACRTDG